MRITFDIDDFYMEKIEKYVGEGKKFKSTSSFCRNAVIELIHYLENAETLYEKKDE
jgi:Arc/MetJ-type ribon-helix-helix transcriptional regulator